MELMGIICLPKAVARCGGGSREEEERGHVLCPGVDFWGLPDPRAFQKSSPTYPALPFPLVTGLVTLPEPRFPLLQTKHLLSKHKCVYIFFK